MHNLQDDEILDFDNLSDDNNVSNDVDADDVLEDDDLFPKEVSEENPAADIEEFVTKRRNPKGASHSKGRFKRNRPSSVLFIILVVTTLLSLSLCIYVLSHPRYVTVESNSISEASITTYTQEEVDQMMADAANQREMEIKESIRSQLEVSNPSVSETLRQLFSESIIYLDADGYHFIPISDTIPHNNLIRENFSVNENGEITYRHEGALASQKGIDVSQHQGVIDWSQVGDSGVEFAFIRAGFRGYGSGALVTDEQFEANMEGANEAGIATGVYFFTQAITVEEAIEEAQYVLELIAPYEITYPVVIDVEKPDSSEARANTLSREERTLIVQTFCDTIAAAGYTPMIYGNTNSLFGMLDIEIIHSYPIWYAFYNTYPYYPYAMQVWQYTANGSVPGISGTVDLNIWFPEELTEGSENTPEPSPENSN